MSNETGGFGGGAFWTGSDGPGAGGIGGRISGSESGGPPARFLRRGSRLAVQENGCSGTRLLSAKVLCWDMFCCAAYALATLEEGVYMEGANPGD